MQPRLLNICLVYTLHWLSCWSGK